MRKIYHIAVDVPGWIKVTVDEDGTNAVKVELDPGEATVRLNLGGFEQVADDVELDVTAEQAEKLLADADFSSIEFEGFYS